MKLEHTLYVIIHMISIWSTFILLHYPQLYCLYSGITNHYNMALACHHNNYNSNRMVFSVLFFFFGWGSCLYYISHQRSCRCFTNSRRCNLPSEENYSTSCPSRHQLRQITLRNISCSNQSHLSLLDWQHNRANCLVWKLWNHLWLIW